MPRVLSLTLLVVAMGLAWLWLSGGFDEIAAFAAGEQRSFQNDIAGTLRRLRGGEPGALMLLLLACFAYGFFHAVGPGHGKLLVGGYGVGRKVAMGRLSVIALLSSLGQAVTAIVLAYGGLWLWGLSRERMIGAAEGILAPASYAAIGMVGVWLLLRGARGLMRAQPSRHDHAHFGEEEACSSCGHSHGPSLAQVDGAGTMREAMMLIGGIALRPCTGALFVLIITWQMGIPGAGVLGAFAMALGTALVTVAVGLAASGFRGGVLRGLGAAPAVVWVIPALEVAAGSMIAVLATGLLLRTL